MGHKIISTAIGSLPHQDVRQATELIRKVFTEAPFWPQLPKRDFREGMYIQYSEGLPGATIDSEKQRLFFSMDGAFASDKEKFMEALMQDDLDAFAMSAEYAGGLFAFLDACKNGTSAPPMVKGQVTGPISLGLTVTDEKNRSILYNPEFEEIITHGLMMKARWQARKLLEVSPQAIIFIDEPYLASFGSAFISLEREQVIQTIALISDAIRGEGVKSGAHCCGNTDWTLLMEAGVDIINFDAVAYTESMTLYPEKLLAYLQGGGSLAWGVVPNSDSIREETSASVVKRFWDGIHALEAKKIPLDLLLSSVWITPCCGAGSMQEKDAEKMIRLANEAAEMIKEEWK
jgi:methionine synthase II (cobalamin-independent)